MAIAITKSGKNWKRLYAAVQQDDVATVREIAGRLDLSKTGKYRDVCLAAAHAGASNSLEALLEAGGGFHFDSMNRDYYSRFHAEKLIKEALASPNPSPLLSVIYAANKKEDGRRVSVGEFINKDTPIDVIQDCLDKNTAYFSEFLNVTGMNSMEKLNAILAYKVAAPKSQYCLNGALATVAEMGDVEKTKLLLQHGANPNAAAAQALLNAGKGKHEGHKKVVGLLLPHVTPELCGNVLTRLQQRPEKIDNDILAAIETAAQRATPEQPTVPAAPEQQQPLKGRFNRLSEDILEEVKPPSGGSEQIVRYDWDTQQQTFLKDGATTHVEDFNNVAENVIAKMRARLEALPNPDKPAQQTLKLRPQ